ncbi:MAG: hypothetical protein J6Z79_01585, partial [Clostridia bacterium]|nr:hypothetical protein [Clostridia bacterium]
MKRILSMLLIVALLSTLLVVPANADAIGTIALTSSPSSVTKGGTVSVTISLTQNPGLTGLTLSVGYPSDWTLTAVAEEKMFGATGFTSPNLENNPVTLPWLHGTENITATGTLATLTFSVSDSATLGDQTITVSCSEAYDTGFNDATISDASVTVSVVSCVHANTEQVPAEAATCVDPGHEAGTKCKDCDD